ncbi:hypothetical protein STRCR_0388 [Streptococcus criceti HS-6]|uniref:Uncharacterized protein n=1 Tax=Streptococcus criceti HS-6 TaxID=873449 RepID=G5JPN5_STRCG|nr:hypothetical protein STRCR_0388 [Streptococcus criceti HS-6]
MNDGHHFRFFAAKGKPASSGVIKAGKKYSILLFFAVITQFDAVVDWRP